VLNYATTDCGKAAERIIDNKGLPLLFGIFMGKSRVKGVKPGSDAAQQETEHLVSLLANTFQHVTSKCALLVLPQHFRALLRGWRARSPHARSRCASRAG